MHGTGSDDASCAQTAGFARGGTAVGPAENVPAAAGAVMVYLPRAFVRTVLNAPSLPAAFPRTSFTAAPPTGWPPCVTVPLTVTLAPVRFAAIVAAPGAVDDGEATLPAWLGW